MPKERLSFIPGRVSAREYFLLTVAATEKDVVIFARGHSNQIDMNRLVNQRTLSEAYQTMIASERVLARDWNHPEEDAAWADL